MLPEKIRVKNFMCYRDDVPPLDFAGIHLACLSGENGAGKSALLDALTWALWGKARVSSDDELISLGAQEMEVDLHFSVGANRYRVMRRRQAGKRSQTMLDIQIETPSGWKPISGNTMRETQHVIEQLLRMEYDTFINSAFLVQGKADEFTRKAPAERKKVLAEILGLDEYERLEQRAKEQEKQLRERLQGLEGTMANLRERVNKRDFYLSQQAEAEIRVAQWETNERTAQATLDQALERKRQLEARRVERDREQTNVRNLQTSLAELHAEHGELSRTLDYARSIVARRTEIEQGAAQLTAARAELARFDQLYERALVIAENKRAVRERITNERFKLESQHDRLHEQIEQAQVLIDTRPSIIAELDQLEAQLAEFAAIEHELAQARAERDQLEQQSNQLAQLQVDYQRVLGAINVHKDSLIAAREEQNRRVADYDSYLANEPRWRDEYATATAQQRTLNRDERRLNELRNLDQADTQRLGEMTAYTTTLKTQAEGIKHKLSEFQTLHHEGETHCPLCQSELGHAGIAQIEHNYNTELDQLRAEYRETDNKAKSLKHEVDARRREMQGLERKLLEVAKLSATVARLEQQLQEADDQRLRRSEAQSTMLDLDRRLQNDDFAHEDRASLAQLERDIAAFGVDSATLETQRRDTNNRINQHERDLTQRGAIQARAAVLSQQLSQIELAQTSMTQWHDQALTVQVKLDSDDYAHADQEQMRQLDQQMADLGYGKNAHNEIKAQVAELEHWAEQAAELKDATKDLASNEKQLQRMNDLITRTDQDLATANLMLEQLHADVAQLPAAMQASDEAQRTFNEARGRLSIAQKDLGAAQNDVAITEQFMQQLEDFQKEYTQLQDEQSIYADLVKAFGKKGIQAMLIETAIPELERESNNLLARMTDNQMHMRFETQKETKKGDTNETLDIHIADEQGTRRYDLYSGGEAFRINFAIRIALSKMLARRAGANLQTLIIDEGFGSQDGRGRERLVEAIQHVQSDFNRILVITHIQELKDQFPVQIEINKTPIGSRWSVS